MIHPSRFALSAVALQRHASSFFRRVKKSRPPPEVQIHLENAALRKILQQLHHSRNACLQKKNSKPCMKRISNHSAEKSQKVHGSGPPAHVKSRTLPKQRFDPMKMPSRKELSPFSEEARNWIRVIYRNGPINAYISFVRSVRQQVKKKHPDKHYVQRWKIIADMYRRLSVCDKEVHREKAKVRNAAHRLPLFH